ncbi:MAG: hypothetical protein GOVbin703_109 [Prokaryotic dsDNA virus sp.]|nr:MAG: hypothetical protein GOVbin703_109 [Prokaryotic dsDNA virus sp.]|tara:strand:+ start:20624 stop:21493 length:870 start_codon:yes stop_codon:yes gene_type:complete
MRNNDERTGAVQQPDSPAPAQAQKGLNLNFVAPTEFVEIPSRGKFYPQGHPLHNKHTVEIKHMTAREEDILTSQTLLKQGVALDRFLQSVLLDKAIDINTLLVGDKNALIVAARCTGYGDDYETTLTCPSCMAQVKETLDLSECREMVHGYNEQDAEEPLPNVVGPSAAGTYMITLPTTNAVFEVKLMNGRDEKAFAKRMETRKKKKQGEALMTDQFKTFTVSINGVDIPRQMYSFIDNLPVKDSRFLRTAYNALTPAVNLKHDFACTECAYEQEVEVPITAQFFWPDA